MSLHDEHLKTALRHAPDQDLAPSQKVRDNVLAYATNAVKPTPSHWLKRSLNIFATWRVKTWQVSSMGVLASVLLVFVMLHEQMSQEPIWVESDNKSVAQAEVTANTNAPERYQVTPELAERDAPIKEEAKARKNLAKLQAPAKELSEKTQIASSLVLSKTADMANAVEAFQTPEATVVAAAPAEVDTKQNLSKARQTAGSVMKEVPMSEALIAEALVNQGGETMAKQDIADGNLRILKIETEACDKLGKIEAHDVDTNYKVMAICDSDDKTRSETLQMEVSAYNQTMYIWHQTHQN